MLVCWVDSLRVQRRSRTGRSGSGALSLYMVWSGHLLFDYILLHRYYVNQDLKFNLL